MLRTVGIIGLTLTSPVIWGKYRNSLSSGFLTHNSVRSLYVSVVLTGSWDYTKAAEMTFKNSSGIPVFYVVSSRLL